MVGVIGISGTKVTPAGTIVENLIQSGTSRNNIFIVHPKEKEINGCECLDSLDSLKKRIKGEKIGLFVVGVPAAGPKGRTAIDVVEYIVKNNLSESVLIISAGFDETENGRKGAEKLRSLIIESRKQGKDTPVISGPNNLGNIYGRIDTRFTPSYKSSANGVGRKNVALVCQSGAFMLTRLSDLAGVVNPATAISIGNQLDLTFSDYMEFLEDQPGYSVFGVYVEGFKYGDGLKFCNIVKRMAAKGKKVIVYKAGKTPEGQDATQGHTASIAGDYAAAERLLRQSGAFVAESFGEFQSMIKLSSLLEGSVIDPSVTMPRVAALSNAGFEKCAIGDNLYSGGRKIMEIVDYSEKTKGLIYKIFEKYGLLNFIDIGDILDLTPIANDVVYKEIVETIMEDPNVDCGLISIVPETAMLQTLDSKKHNESFSSDTGIARYLADIRNNTNKPMIVSLESGKLYDPMVSYLEMANIPTFRVVESAAKMLGKYMQFRIANKIWKY
jgi:acyl-CoA synthetase (NDP forming)